MATTNKAYPETDPRHHTANIKGMLREATDHAREDVRKVEDAHARALFETTAEVLEGLARAYDHFEGGGEAAWR